MSLHVLRFLPEASEELVGTAAWYEKQKVGLGQRFLDEATAARERLVQFPESGSLFPRRMRGRVVRRIWLTGFPIALVYTLDEETVEAVRNIEEAIRDYLAVVDEQLEGTEVRELEVAV